MNYNNYGAAIHHCDIVRGWLESDLCNWTSAFVKLNTALGEQHTHTHSTCTFPIKTTNRICVCAWWSGVGCLPGPGELFMTKAQLPSPSMSSMLEIRFGTRAITSRCTCRDKGNINTNYKSQYYSSQDSTLTTRTATAFVCASSLT